ncbi:hypothetical protein GCM10009555_093410 [Acrocarpospora macrocephala]|uniref:Uncharacterized protein n=1 Tax=Acrocarpospora macrocephala TaxID=150177 RepID=A0A5M3X591_9ACTN|nr:hypothetical protein Amac_076100 [Acrocarpospora macrocephala]
MRCRIPIPPWRAIATAIRASVTVSIAAEISGIRNVIFLDNRVEVSASPGCKSEYAGTSRTSSNVSPGSVNFPIICAPPTRRPALSPPLVSVVAHPNSHPSTCG